MKEQRASYEYQLAYDVGGFAYDPLGFVLYAFPWGDGELKDRQGPEPWQAEELEQIGLALRNNANVSTAIQKAIRRAIASGHGIGKSTFVAWIILWGLSTFQDARGVVTANTETQLKGKTWAELSKWHRLCLCGDWFDCTATALISKKPGHEKTWRIDMVPWSERNTEAFAGLHNKNRRVILIFDEASSIPDSIWEVSEGALTDDDTEIIWVACGNPTRNTGRFRDCFGRYMHRWSNRKIDSRTVSITNKAQIQEWFDDYGEDSDFFRIRVCGEFPNAASNQLIPSDVVEAASKRIWTTDTYSSAPIIMGVDVARFGDDDSVIIIRQGLQVCALWRFHGLDTMSLADVVANKIKQCKPAKVFIDVSGVGAGVVDRLRQLGFDVTGVEFGSRAGQTEKYANKRAEMWGNMRDWLAIDMGAILDDDKLKYELTAPEYTYSRNSQLLLEKKEDMKKRGLPSPDAADALALTFAYPVAVNDPSYPWMQNNQSHSDYNPLEY